MVDSFAILPYKFIVENCVDKFSFARTTNTHSTHTPTTQSITSRWLSTSNINHLRIYKCLLRAIDTTDQKFNACVENVWKRRIHVYKNYTYINFWPLRIDLLLYNIFVKFMAVQCWLVDTRQYYYFCTMWVHQTWIFLFLTISKQKHWFEMSSNARHIHYIAQSHTLTNTSVYESIKIYL